MINQNIYWVLTFGGARMLDIPISIPHCENFELKLTHRHFMNPILIFI
jgi:hypothetical protein